MTVCQAEQVGSAGTVSYEQVASSIAATGMTARGAFVPHPDDEVPDPMTGRRARAVVMVGNVGGVDQPMWRRFVRERRDEPDPLDAWTRRTLRPIADDFGATFVHPSDRPYLPFQRWARRAADVWTSPIGLLIDAEHGLWHALRGALIFGVDVVGVPPTGVRTSPCIGCHQPCLSACPVAAFGEAGYDHEACRSHVRSGSRPACRTAGCAARLACPVHPAGAYGPDQMRFHMSAFVGND